MKRIVNAVTLIGKKDNIAKIVNTWFKLELQALDIQLGLYLKGTFPISFFEENFQSDCSFELPWVAVSEKLYSKDSLSKIKKGSKDQKNTLCMCSTE